MKDDTISRAAALDALNGLTKIFLNNLPPTIYKEDAIKAVKALPSAQPSVSKTEIVEDTISRQAALDIYDDYNVAVENGELEAYRKHRERLLALPPTQPDVPDTNVGGNLIDRQAAISEIMEDLEDRSLHDDPATPEDYAEGYDEGIRNAAAIVLQMPSAQPEYEPVKAEDFAKTMSENTIYTFMAWHGEALELMERYGFVICKKMM